MTHRGTVAKPYDKRACATLILDTGSGRLQGGRWRGSDGCRRTFDSATAAVASRCASQRYLAPFSQCFLAGQAIPGLRCRGQPSSPARSPSHDGQRPAHRTDRLVLPRLHEILCAHYGWSDVQVEIVAGGRHYLVEDRPAETIELIERSRPVIRVCCLCGRSTRMRCGGSVSVRGRLARRLRPDRAAIGRPLSARVVRPRLRHPSRLPPHR
jgi:hypothetical protein